MNLYFGDNLKVLQSLPDQSVDLVYADPPFNTGKDWGAYDDRWEEGLAGYLDFMRPRLEEIKRLLKTTGSFYLHCDPTASHYLKVMLDQVFGITNFRNEIVWCYSAGGNSKKTFPKKHDILLLYGKQAEKSIHNPLRGLKYNDFYAYDKYGDTNINKGYHPEGKLFPDWWDISVIYSTALERLDYPTQKPVALLERIIKASSNEGDIVLDPFAGSGTTLDAAHGLRRKWIGIDEGKQSIETITFRLADRHGLLPGDEYELHGDTQDINLPTVEDATPQQINLL